MDTLSFCVILFITIGLSASESSSNSVAADIAHSAEIKGKKIPIEVPINDGPEYIRKQPETDISNILETTNTDDQEREDQLQQQKRMRIGSILGNGLNFGKRFGSILGNGMSYGKRFGSVLGNGMSYGKRFGSVLGNGMSYGKRFGSVLGNGMSYGKRFGSVLGHGMGYGKRFGSILGNGINFGKRYGYLLGKGFSMNKRQPELYQNVQSNPDTDLIFDFKNDDLMDKRDTEDTIDDDFEIVDLDGPVDEKRWMLNDIYGGGYPTYKRSKRDTTHKRYIHYFGNMLGRGFSAGKRDDRQVSETISAPLVSKMGVGNMLELNEDELPMDKRYYSGMLGNGYMFGKRQKNLNRDQRRFGNVLGHGFSFGKRGDETDIVAANMSPEYTMKNELDNDIVENTQGEINMNTPDLDNSDDDIEDGPEKAHRKRYFLSSPGHRFMFGKRDIDDRDARFGFVLGRGFSYGKRGRIPRKERKRPYGFVLGNGYSFGKRVSEYVNEIPKVDNQHIIPDSVYTTTDLIKRASFLLGKGYMFGKRGSKRFGWILGNGLRFGKRDGDYLESKEDISLFVDESGHVFVRADHLDGINELQLENSDATIFGCAGNLVPHVTDQLDETRKVFKSTNRILNRKKRSTLDNISYVVDAFGNIYVRVDDISSPDNPLLSTDEDVAYYTCDGQLTALIGDNNVYEDISKRAFGTILGNGFRFGKRVVGSRKRSGLVLGNGFTGGK